MKKRTKIKLFKQSVKHLIKHVAREYYKLEIVFAKKN